MAGEAPLNTLNFPGNILKRHMINTVKSERSNISQMYHEKRVAPLVAEFLRAIETDNLPSLKRLCEDTANMAELEQHHWLQVLGSAIRKDAIEPVSFLFQEVVAKRVGKSAYAKLKDQAVSDFMLDLLIKLEPLMGESSCASSDNAQSLAFDSTGENGVDSVDLQSMYSVLVMQADAPNTGAMEHETVLPLDLTEPDYIKTTTSQVELEYLFVDKKGSTGQKSGADKDVVYRWDPKSMYFVKVPRMSNGCEALPDGVVASRPDPGMKRQNANPDKGGCNSSSG
jgi:hypothetical protein